MNYKSIQNQIIRYKEYIEKENPLMFRSINAYREYLPKLYAKLRESEKQEIKGKKLNETKRIFN